MEDLKNGRDGENETEKTSLERNELIRYINNNLL